MVDVPIRIIPITDFGTLFHPRAGKYATFWSIINESVNFTIQSSFARDSISSIDKEELESTIFILGMPRVIVDESFSLLISEKVREGAKLVVVCGGGHHKSLESTRDLLKNFDISVKLENTESKSYMGRNRNILIFEPGNVSVDKSGKDGKFALRLVHDIECIDSDWRFPDNSSRFVMMTKKYGEGSIGVISSDYLFSRDPETGLRSRSNIHLVATFFDKLVGKPSLFPVTKIETMKEKKKRRKRTTKKTIIKKTPVVTKTTTKSIPEAKVRIIQKDNNNNETNCIWEGRIYTIIFEGEIPERIEVKPNGLFQFLSTWQIFKKMEYAIDFTIEPALAHEISQNYFPTSIVTIEIHTESGNLTRTQIRAYRKARHLIWRILIIIGGILSGIASLFIL